jgi:hypothetical protein
VIVRGRYFPWEKVQFCDIRFGQLVFNIVSPGRPWEEAVYLLEIPNYLVVLTLLGGFGVPFGSP